MKLLLDANLSHRLVNQLRIAYPLVSHILEFFHHNEKDSIIWNFAKGEGYTIVTNDEDFVSLLTIKGWPPKVVLLKTGNQANSYLAELLLKKHFEIESFLNNPTQGMLVIY